jgi:hypothetical protein
VALVAVGWPAITHADAALARAQALEEATAQALQPADQNPIYAWQFIAGLPSGWTRLPQARLVAERGATTITTRPSVGAYQVWSPALSVKTGTYAVVVDGRVERGGITVGALDVTADKWIAQTSYRAGQAIAHGGLVTHLSLDTPRIVQIILTNWSPHALGSQWRIRAVQLHRLPR